MSTKVALEQAAPTAALFSFAEETCHNQDELRPVRQPTVFRVFSIGRGLRAKVDVSFESDYGIYYDPDDMYLIGVLQRACPQVNWFHNKVYHRHWDYSKIQILDAETSALIGQIETRRYMGRKVKPESVRAGVYGPKVLNLEDLRAARELKKQAAALVERLQAQE